MSHVSYLPSLGDSTIGKTGSRKYRVKSCWTKRPVFTAALCICLVVLIYRKWPYGSVQIRPSQNSPDQTLKPSPIIIDSQTLSSHSPTLPPTELEVVVASLAKENTTWLSTFFPSWPLKIYIVDNSSAALTVPKNKGHESMVYLTYIIDNYHSLPSLVLFLHASRYQWHNDNPDYDGLTLLRNLQLPYLRKQGYVNLRCAWILGCPTEIRPFEDLGSKDKNKVTAAAYKGAFEELFPDERIPKRVGVACCAQFSITSDTIRKKSREEYVRLRDWLLETELEDRESGRVFEYSWHMIFGKPPVHCPNARDCYCNVFGLCDLKCDKRACEGQYVLPKYSTMPEGWPLLGWEGESRTFEGPL